MIVKFLFSKIICCRYFNPLKLFKVLINILLFKFNFSEIFKTNDRFSRLPADKKYLFFISLIILLAFFKSTLIIFGLYFLLFNFLFISTSFFFTNDDYLENVICLIKK